MSYWDPSIWISLAARLAYSCRGSRASISGTRDCYCVDSDFNSELAADVVKLRRLLGEARKAGKLTGYIRVPISGRGGGYLSLNLEVATSVKRVLEDRLCADSFFALSPGTPEATIGSLPTPAGGTKSASWSEYMSMWTEVPEGVKVGVKALI